MSNQSERRVGTRIEILNDLIQHRASVTDATEQLAEFPWDSDDELVILTRPDVLATLAKLLRDNLSADDVERWADVLEVRDDVGLESAHEHVLRQFLYEASTPETEGPLTAEWAEAWVLRLTGLA